MKLPILIFISLISIATWNLPMLAAAGITYAPGKMADGAPAELMYWGKLVGQWSTVEESLKPDGSGWEPSTGADWDFFWAFDGWGIQDDYTSPPLAVRLEDEATRQRGINLRIYNPTEKKWVVTWLTIASSKPSTLTAISTDENIVMLTDSADANGNYGRITFSDMTKTQFEWKLEWSKDRQNWLEVHRIHAEKKSDLIEILR